MLPLTPDGNLTLIDEVNLLYFQIIKKITFLKATSCICY